MAENYTINKKNLPVAYKVCSKCGGSGQVPCDGREHYRRKYREWAETFHLMPVVFSWLGKASIPGIAVSQLLPVGWYGLKVYVAVSDIPRAGVIEAGNGSGYAFRLDGRGVPQAIIGVQGVDLHYFDIVNDKAYWYLFCHSTRRDELRTLDYWPDDIKLKDVKLLVQQN